MHVKLKMVDILGKKRYSAMHLLSCKIWLHILLKFLP